MPRYKMLRKNTAGEFLPIEGENIITSEDETAAHRRVAELNKKNGIHTFLLMDDPEIDVNHPLRHHIHWRKDKDSAWEPTNHPITQGPEGEAEYQIRLLKEAWKLDHPDLPDDVMPEFKAERIERKAAK